MQRRQSRHCRCRRLEVPSSSAPGPPTPNLFSIEYNGQPGTWSMMRSLNKVKVIKKMVQFGVLYSIDLGGAGARAGSQDSHNYHISEWWSGVSVALLVSHSSAIVHHKIWTCLVVWNVVVWRPSAAEPRFFMRHHIKMGWYLSSFINQLLTNVQCTRQLIHMTLARYAKQGALFNCKILSSGKREIFWM